MLRLYRFLIGYLTVVLVGNDCEKILNIAARERIIFNALYYRKGKIEGRISVSDFRRMRYLLRGSKTRIHVMKKHGLPFIIDRYNNRLGFFAGFALFFAIIYVLSLFVWNVEVSGNKRVSNQEIISVCNKLSIAEGRYKGAINPKTDAQRFLLNSKGIAWASITIEGCVLTVNVSEIKNEANIRKEPCNIIASHDGIIKRMDITQGNSVVAVDDVVKKGDLLVSGIFERLEGTEFVYSEGVVEAQTTRTFTAEADYIQTKKEPTGKKYSHTVFSAFNIDIPLYIGQIKGDCIFETNHKQLQLFGKKIPVSLTTKNCSMTRDKSVKYSEQELKDMLKKDIKAEISKTGIKKYTVKEENFVQTEKGIKLTVTIVGIENIAQKEKILVGS